MTTFTYLIIRGLLWVLCVVISLVPSLQSAKHFLPFSLYTLASSLNTVGKFREIVFVIVTGAAISFTTACDFECTSPKCSEITRLAVIATLLVNFCILISGLVIFLWLPAGEHALPIDQLDPLYYVVLWGVILSFLSEIAVSWAHKRHRKR